MNKSERIKKLLRGYFKGKLTDAEKETLLFLIHQDDLNEAVYCEQYKVWDESPDQNKHINSGELFEKIRAEANITDEMLVEGDQILKGFRFDQLKSRKIKIYSFLKYAAVILLTVLFSGITYYIAGRLKTEEIACNEIVVPYGSRIKVTLADSSEVWLNSGSRFSYPSHFAKGSREVHLEGEAFFDIRRNPKQPFYVRTSGINIKVLGTRFNVKSYPEEDIIETTLVSGKLIVETKGSGTSIGTKTVLYPNQKASYSKKVNKLEMEIIEPIKDQKSDMKRLQNLSNIDNLVKLQPSVIETSWTDNLLIFHDEPLSSLAKSLERWYNVEISIKDTEIGDYKFTGSFKNETIEQVMKGFSYASGLDYKIEHNKIEISTKK
jgi:transmembrane sensor